MAAFFLCLLIFIEKVIKIMGIYIKLFDTHSQYESYTADTANFILPNVSYCIDTPNEVHYNPVIPDPSGGHEYVEMGGIKWATMNIGANSVTDCGLYFQWGDTQGYTADQCGSGSGQKYFDWTDYKFGGNGDRTQSSKYNTSDGKTVLDAEDDAVTAAWGGNWRMPTIEEIYYTLGNDEIVETAYTSNYQGSGVAGLIVRDKNNASNELFFPSCGNLFMGSVNSLSSYWSSTTSYYTDGSTYIPEESSWWERAHRCFGNQVRGVLDV